MNNSEQPKSIDLLSKLGLYTTIAIVIGAMIGSGIFKKPATMASQLGSPELLIAIWVVAGIISLFGALTNGEVAGMISKTGGQYIYFQKMYGDFFGFIYGWAMLVVVQTGSIASISYVFAEYTQYFWHLPRFSQEIEQSVRIFLPGIGEIFPLQDFGVKFVAIFVVNMLSFVNYFGVKSGGLVSAFFTWAKVAAIAALVFFGFMYGSGSFSNFTTDAPGFTMSGISLMGGIIAALSGAFWAFDGWNNITYIGKEVKDANRTIPKALFWGTLIVIIIYVLTNLAYLYVMPVEQMAGSHLVASDVANRAFGSFGAGFVAAAVMISTFGTSNGTILVSARVYFAMSRDKLFYEPFGRIQPKYRTPANALFLQSAWTSVLILSGTFDILTDMLIFVSWVFYALGAYGVFVLRKKMPDTPRPYKVFGYPYIPVIFIVFAAVFVFLTLYNDIATYYETREALAGETNVIRSLFGTSLVATGVPFYLYFRWKNNKAKKIN